MSVLEIKFSAPDFEALAAAAEEPPELREPEPEPEPVRRAPDAPVVSRNARRETAGHRAMQRLIDAHRAEYSRLAHEEHTAADSTDETQQRVNRLVRGGIALDVAEAFAAGAWPRGEIAPGILLEVTGE